MHVARGHQHLQSVRKQCEQLDYLENRQLRLHALQFLLHLRAQARQEIIGVHQNVRERI